eukprot:CCRYP_002248-RA/>CCRYP_002248-RA protein AED:0.37 eAED:0.37 QI:118/1/1/1/1/1/3/272/171
MNFLKLAIASLLGSVVESVSVGDKLPSVDLHSGFPPKKVPSYLELQDALHDKGGVDEIIIYCVNDGAVMSAWARDLGVQHYEADDNEGRITFLGDPEGVLTRQLEMELTHPGPISVGIVGRCKRFAIYAVGGVVKYVAVSEAEDDPAGDARPEATMADAMLRAVLSLKEEL